MFIISPKYRKNLKNFKGVYIFKDRKNPDVAVSVIFENERMTVHNGNYNNANVKVEFKDEAALLRLLLSGSIDIIGSILSQDIEVTGNLNYLYKFGYMAIHLVTII